MNVWMVLQWQRNRLHHLVSWHLWHDACMDDGRSEHTMECLWYPAGSVWSMVGCFLIGWTLFMGFYISFVWKAPSTRTKALLFSIAISFYVFINQNCVPQRRVVKYHVLVILALIIWPGNGIFFFSKVTELELVEDLSLSELPILLLIFTL